MRPEIGLTNLSALSRAVPAGGDGRGSPGRATDAAGPPLKTEHSMRHCWRSLGVIGLVLLSACERPTNMFGEPVDVDAARVELMETDMAWSQAASVMEDLDLVASYWSDEAMVMGAGSPTVSGKEAILAMVEASAEIPGFRIEWEPEGVDVGPSGRMGYTWGRNAISVADPDGGPPIVTEGRYLTVWRKNLDGEWKCVMDVWTDAPDEIPMPPVEDAGGGA